MSQTPWSIEKLPHRNAQDTHLSPSVRQDVQSRHIGEHRARNTEDPIVIAAHGGNICPSGFCELSIFPRPVKQGEYL